MTNKKQYMNPIAKMNEAIAMQQERIKAFESQKLSPEASQIISEAKEILAKSIRNRDSLLRKIRALEGHAL